MALVLALLGGSALVAMHSLLWTVTVVGGSMEPTFRNGETMVAARLWPARWLRRGSIVLIQGLARSDGSSPCLFVKRVAYLPGDRINLHAEPGETGPSSPEHIPAGVRLPLALAHNQVFVISDNLSGGMDSRSWGPIPTSALAGLVLMRLARSRRES
jgi:signal peptidase I